MVKIILVCAATSADILAVVAGLRAAGIKLPLLSAAAVSFTGALVLWLSAFISSSADAFIPIDGLLYLSKILLGLMGIHTILADYFSAHEKKNDESNISISFSRAMADPASADQDHSKKISLREAICLGTALSADSVFTGISAGIAGLPHLTIFIFSAVFGLAAVFIGYATGGLLSRISVIKFPSERISGIILLTLALLL